MNNNKIWLYLDDVRVPNSEEWKVVRNYEEFVGQIRLYGLENFELISLDHDLGDTAMYEYYNNAKPNYKIEYSNILEKTGMDCAKWLVEHSIDTKIPLPTVKVHSANPIGAANMMGYLNNYYKNCHQEEVCTKIEIAHTYINPLTPNERIAKYKKVAPCVGHELASQEEDRRSLYCNKHDVMYNEDKQCPKCLEQSNK